MTRVERIAGCLVIGLVIACPLGGTQAEEAPAAEVQQVGQSIEDAGEDVADWILRLFRGVDDTATKPKAGPRGGKDSEAGQGTGAGSAHGGGGDDDGGDDGGGDDGGGDDGGDD